MNAREKKLMQIIWEAKKIVFFGGAGVSTGSGIPDFRGAEGLYSYTPEEVISHHFFMENNKEFYEFYFDKMVYPKAKPNQCHKFLAKLEQNGKLSAIITQNIDGLHQKAGSKNVFELHGSVHKNTCMKCGKNYTLEELMKLPNQKCSVCGGLVKPDVVLYEEPLDFKVTQEAVKAIEEADTLIVAGTSLVVYPAAGFINYFHGKNLITINLGETSASSMADLTINGKVEDYLNMKNYHKYLEDDN